MEIPLRRGKYNRYKVSPLKNTHSKSQNSPKSKNNTLPVTPLPPAIPFFVEKLKKKSIKIFPLKKIGVLWGGKDCCCNVFL